MPLPLYLDRMLEELIQIKLADVGPSQPWSGQASPMGARLPSIVPPFTAPKPIVKRAFQTSQFSGPLSYGGFKQESLIPAFRQPAIATKIIGRTGTSLPDPGSPIPLVKRAASGYGDTMPVVTSAASALRRTQGVGRAKTSPPPGPSIASIASPQNVGKGSAIGPPIPGATKFSGGI